MGKKPGRTPSLEEASPAAATTHLINTVASERRELQPCNHSIVVYIVTKIAQYLMFMNINITRNNFKLNVNIIKITWGEHKL
jgi:hypothetical protein